MPKPRLDPSTLSAASLIEELETRIINTELDDAEIAALGKAIEPIEANTPFLNHITYIVTGAAEEDALTEEQRKRIMDAILDTSGGIDLSNLDEALAHFARGSYKSALHSLSYSLDIPELDTISEFFQDFAHSPLPRAIKPTTTENQSEPA